MTAAADALRAAFADALSSLDLSRRTYASLPDTPPGGARVTLIALGKCAATMTAGAMRRWGPFIDEAVISRPSRARDLDPVTREALAHTARPAEIFTTGHPLPDAASERAGRAMFTAACAAAKHGRFVLVLLSGGASAAACVPTAGTSLERLRESVRDLLASGADIATVNAARARLDRFKLGGLARAARTADMLTLAAADVLAEGVALQRAVGSGPTVEPRPTSPRGERTYHFVATPADAREAMATALVSHGFSHAISLPDARGDVDSLARMYSSALHSMAPGEVRVAVGEPTVVLPDSPGRGGRAGRLALLVARAIRGLEGASFLAGATDGVDGESGHAGAVVDHTSWESLGELRGDALLASFDDATAHEALSSCLDVGTTGINLLDLHVLVRAQS